jgi:hypothetical protein
MTPWEVVDALDRFPGVGAVLYPSNYGAAASLPVKSIAYVGSVADAEIVASTASAWLAAIVLDERNQTGPSGAYMSPDHYAVAYETISRPLVSAGVPVSTMGLAPVRSFWRDVFRCRAFDDWYHRRLPTAELRAFNPNGVRSREVERALRFAPRWIVSPAPFRGWWDHLWSPVKVREWARFARDPRVLAVALWCLREVKHGDRWQVEHGLLDRFGRMTAVGREVEREMGSDG